MKRVAIRMLGLGLVVALLEPAGAQSFPYGINVHFGDAPATAFACRSTEDLPDALLGCQVITPTATFPPPTAGGIGFIWLVVSGVDTNPAYNGIGGIQFGIDYSPALHSNPQWHLCTGGLTLSTWVGPNGEWPQPGSAAAFTWAGGCHNVTANADGVTKIGFVAFVGGPFGPDTYSIIEDGSVLYDPSYGVPAALASTCTPSLEIRICRQLLGWGSTAGPGLNTCGFLCTLPVEERTWSRLKSNFN